MSSSKTPHHQVRGHENKRTSVQKQSKISGSKFWVDIHLTTVNDWWNTNEYTITRGQDAYHRHISTNKNKIKRSRGKKKKTLAKALAVNWKSVLFLLINKTAHGPGWASRIAGAKRRWSWILLLLCSARKHFFLLINEEEKRGRNVVGEVNLGCSGWGRYRQRATGCQQNKFCDSL